MVYKVKTVDRNSVESRCVIELVFCAFVYDFSKVNVFKGINVSQSV